MKILVIIPAYNEEKTIKEVVASVQKVSRLNNLNIEVAVVNDGSDDNSQKIISSLHCTSLNLPINLGIGGAVQTGFKYAYEEGCDIAVRIDGDNQHKAEFILKLIEPIIRKEANVVIGSRFLQKNNAQISRIRRSGISMLCFINNIFSHYRIKDVTSGFIAYDRDAIELMKNEYPEDYPEPESIIILEMRGFMIKEVQVEMRKRETGRSSITFLKSLYYMIKVPLAIFFNYLRK